MPLPAGFAVESTLSQGKNLLVSFKTEKSVEEALDAIVGELTKKNWTIASKNVFDTPQGKSALFQATMGEDGARNITGVVAVDEGNEGKTFVNLTVGEKE